MKFSTNFIFQVDAYETSTEGNKLMNTWQILLGVTAATVGMNAVGMFLGPGKGVEQSTEVAEVYRMEFARNKLNSPQLEIAQWCANSAAIEVTRKGATSLANYCSCVSVETTKYAPKVSAGITRGFKAFFVSSDQQPDLSTEQSKSQFLQELLATEEFQALTSKEIEIASSGMKQVGTTCAPIRRGQLYTR